MAMSVKQYLDWKRKNDPDWGLGKRLLGDALTAMGPLGLIGLPWLLAESRADRKKADAILNPPRPPQPKPETPKQRRKRLGREKAEQIRLARATLRDSEELAFALAHIEEEYRTKGLA